jgi:hypothetical protein
MDYQRGSTVTESEYQRRSTASVKVQAAFQAAGFVLVAAFIVYYLVRDAAALPPGTWREFVNTVLIVFVVLPSPVWIIVLFWMAFSF